MRQDYKSHADLEIAVIGDYQIGKSTLVNCLIGYNGAEVGRGVSTTHELRSYAIGDGISIVDTPGFNAPNEGGQSDEREAMAAIKRAFAVVVVLTQSMGVRCKTVIDAALHQGKRCFVVYNCRDRNWWSPQECEDIRLSIEADLKNSGRGDSFIKADGISVYSINVLWASYGLGLLTDEKEIKKIRNYAYGDLEVDRHSDLRTEMLLQSRFTEVCNRIRQLPLVALSDFVSNRQFLKRTITERFAQVLTERSAG